MIFRYIPTALIACAMTTNLAQAQSSAQNGTIFDDWRLTCRAPAVDQTVCNIFQVLTVTETGDFLAEVSLQPAVVDGEAAVVLALSTPTDMLLTMRPGYKVGAGSETLPLEWRTCSSSVCLASRVLQKDEVLALKAGSEIVMGYQSVNQAAPLRFSVSLKGVTEGLASMTQ